MPTKEMEMSQEETNMLKSFRDELCMLSKEVDPEERHNWETLAYGFFIGKGMDIEQADKLSWFAARHALNLTNGNVLFKDET